MSAKDPRASAWTIEPRVVLRAVRDDDAQGLLECVLRNRARLRPWMWWAHQTQTLEDIGAFIEKCHEDSDDGPKSMECVLEIEGRIEGMAGLNAVDWKAHEANLGYWIDAAHEGQGLVLRACRTLIEFAFSEWGLERILIRASTENLASRRVAERLGARHEETRSFDELVEGRLQDMHIFAIDRASWSS